MFVIDEKHKNKIIITKGDSATMLLTVTDLLGNNYEIKDTDVAKLTVRKTPNSNPVIQLTATPDHYFVFSPSDTKNLNAGLYMYDIDLTIGTDVYTIVPITYFEIQDEVTA